MGGGGGVVDKGPPLKSILGVFRLGGRIHDFWRAGINFEKTTLKFEFEKDFLHVGYQKFKDQNCKISENLDVV